MTASEVHVHSTTSFHDQILQALLQVLLIERNGFVASSLCFAEIARRAAESMLAARSWALRVKGVVFSSFKQSGAQCNFTAYNFASLLHVD